jgi:hypothetical protein
MIPIDESRLDKIAAKSSQIAKAADSVKPVATQQTRPAESNRIAESKPVQTRAPETRAVDSKPALIATANIPQLSRPTIPQTPINGMSPVNKAVARLSNPAVVGSGYVSHPVLPPPVPKQTENENSIAISGLTDAEISSPKIAMAAYDSWQSPVLDDPLIADESGRVQNVKWTNSAAADAAVVADAQRKAKKSDQKRTDMKLIPPLPSITKDKDGPVDLKIPVLPIR